MLFCGRLRPLTIDIQLIKKWINICTNQHHRSCSVAAERGKRIVEPVKLIRFIDVRNDCIRTIPEASLQSIEYICLSYVWGQGQTTSLSKASKTELSRPEALVKKALPQTITDAVHLTRLLKIPYLWVDILCVVQDDATDLDAQLDNMAKIYRLAMLTIIALGDHANAGLPGLRPETRSFQQECTEVVPPAGTRPGLSLLTTCREPSQRSGYWAYGAHEIDVSTWNSRGWTLQERAVSRRNLIFAKEQLFWVCDGGFFCEESALEHPQLGTVVSEFDTPLRFEPFFDGVSATRMKNITAPLAYNATSTERLWYRYSLLVQDYSRRTFTYLGDVHDAFRAISQSFMEISGSSFHWGHPHSRFESSLLWGAISCRSALRRRTEMTTLPSTSLETRATIPSWSWMGWVGPVNFNVANDRLECENPMISCFIHQSNPLAITSIAHSARCGHNPGPMENLKPTPEAILNEPPITLKDIEGNFPRLSESRLKTIPSYHILFFWAQAANFIVKSPERFPSPHTFYSKEWKDFGVAHME
ncbi:heterokaryon incompatibility protein-domain-containing protein [Xylariaceae sp. FL0255]|nr:heterokaryon incompatibility protein-domain-containing protein [Xylariaceae sp. FL0255]